MDNGATVTRTQTPDGNQTIYATLYQPSDVIETKSFVCGADVHPGYQASALSVNEMRWHGPVEKYPWNYPCYPDC